VPSPGTKYKRSKIFFSVICIVLTLANLGTELLQLPAQSLIGSHGTHYGCDLDESLYVKFFCGIRQYLTGGPMDYEPNCVNPTVGYRMSTITRLPSREPNRIMSVYGLSRIMSVYGLWRAATSKFVVARSKNTLQIFSNIHGTNFWCCVLLFSQQFCAKNLQVRWVTVFITIKSCI